MLKAENVNVFNFEGAIRGARNPMNSWGMSDSVFCDEDGCDYCDYRESGCEYKEFGFKNDDELNSFCIGENDMKLLRKLYKAGTEHRKYMRQIFISMDITAPFYWWKQFDTYKIGTTSNSCSTMHKLTAKEFTLDDFSCEHIGNVPNCDPMYYGALECVITALNEARHCYLDSKDKKYWWQMIQLLPESYNQKRTITMSYENAAVIIKQRRHHKLDEWHQLIDVLYGLPYLKEIIGE